MEQKISELMDGQLSDAELQTILALLKQDQKAQDDWHIYHLIGDVMRQPELATVTASSRFNDRLQQEPVLLQRPHSRVSSTRAWAVSAAATVSAVAVVAWMAVQLTSDVQPRTVMVKANSPQTMPSDGNEYIMAHQQFSYGLDMSGASHAAKTVSYVVDSK